MFCHSSCKQNVVAGLDVTLRKRTGKTLKSRCFVIPLVSKTLLPVLMSRCAEGPKARSVLVLCSPSCNPATNSLSKNVSLFVLIHAAKPENIKKGTKFVLTHKRTRPCSAQACTHATMSMCRHTCAHTKPTAHTHIHAQAEQLSGNNVH
jgi:hypothetical protein